MLKKATYILTIWLFLFLSQMHGSFAASLQTLGFYETPLLDKSLNRTSNIQLAAQKIHQVVINPGEIFSFNQVVGERTKENGFKIASIFENGKVVKGYGGGICQLSSTLYQAVLNAGLEVKEVHRHSLGVKYIAPGKDATVSWGSKDFKFQNSSQDVITIYTELANNIVRATIYQVIEEKPVNLFINNQLIETEPSSYISHGVTYVPLRPLSEHLGYTINWNENTAMITLEKGDILIHLQPYSTTALVNGENFLLTQPPTIKNGVTFIPLSFMVQNFNQMINWSEEENAVFLFP